MRRTVGVEYGAAYHGAYYSQFGQRAVGSVSGMIDPDYWRSLGPVGVSATSRPGSGLLVIGMLVLLTFAWLRFVR